MIEKKYRVFTKLLTVLLTLSVVIGNLMGQSIATVNEATEVKAAGENCEPQIYYGVQVCSDLNNTVKYIKVDLTNDQVRLETIMSHDCNSVNHKGKDQSSECNSSLPNPPYPMETVEDMLNRKKASGAVAIINTDYFHHSPTGNADHGAEGLAIKNGNRFDGPFHADTDNNSIIRTSLAISTSKGISINKGISDTMISNSPVTYHNVVGGGPLIIENGTPKGNEACSLESTLNSGNCTSTTAQSAGGIDANNKLYLVTASSKDSAGLAQYMTSTLQVQRGMKFDGGGSSSLAWVNANGDVIPHYATGEHRKVAQGLLVYSTKITQTHPCGNFSNASAVSVFINRDCEGDSKNYDAGTNRINYIYPDQFNDSISSIRVKQGWSVRVYKDHSFYNSETSRCVTSSLWDLSKDYFRSGQTGLTIEDKISSIQVFNDISCGRGNVCTNPDATVQSAFTRSTCEGGGSGTQTGCAGLANGKYCGTTLGLSSSSLYQCTNGTSSLIQACSYGCNVQAQGTADYCNPAPTTSTNNCPNSLNGKYCGSGLGSQYEQQSLYNCSNGTISKIMACTNGCLQKPAGTDDVCQTPNPGGTGTACPSNGLFCGTTLGRDPNTLYRCNNGAVTVENQCSNGCELKPFGTPDACYPAGSGSGGSTGEKVKIYQDSNYTGALRLETAVDSNDPSLGTPYKSISIPNGWSVILKDKPLGFVGHEQCFNQSVPNLESYGNWAFSLDSIIVHKTNVCPVMSNEAWVRICKVTGWWENNQNDCIKVTENIPDLAGYGFGDNNLKAIFFAGNWEATLYEHGNYEGTIRTISDNNSDLRNISIGYGSSSIQVRSKEPAVFTLRSAVGTEWKSDRSITNLDKWERGAGFTWGDYAKYISVAQGYEVIVFEDQWFTSRSKRFGPGNLMELNELSEKVSSVQVCQGTCPPAPSVPVGISPVDTESFLPGTPISFSWSGNGVRTYIEITGGNLTTPITSNWINNASTWIKTDLPASPNPYYWRVRSGNPYGESNYSPAYSFKVQDIAPSAVYIYQQEDSELAEDINLYALTSPSAAANLNYTWSPTPKSGQGTANAIYNWTTPGQKVIQVTASNTGGSVQKTYEINVYCADGSFLTEYYSDTTLTGSAMYNCVETIDENWGNLGPEGVGFSGMGGNGQDGDLIISTNTTDNPIDSAASGMINTKTLQATNPAFTAGQKVLIHQTQGLTGTGTYQINEIESYSSGVINLKDQLNYSYISNSTSKAQVIVMKQYNNVTVQSGVTFTAKPWNGITGGILSFFAQGEVNILGSISANGGNGNVSSGYSIAGGVGGGFRGGASNKSPQGESHVKPYTGEGHLRVSIIGDSNNGSNSTNGNGGSPATYNNGTLGRSGGGGGNGTPGIAGSASIGGIAYGTSNLSIMAFGGGGGGGGKGYLVGGPAGSGGSGGGIIFLNISKLNINGNVSSNGGNGGQDSQSSGGGGAGGSILIQANSADVGLNRVLVNGGIGGGNGGVGRIAVEYCDSYAGSTNPASNITRKDCNKDNFSARYTKTEVFESGNYTFTTTADDGVRLWIDGNLIIDNWVDGVSTQTASLPLNAGEHTIKLEYYENTGTAQVKLSWTKDSELNQAPVVSQIPGQIIEHGATFSTFDLDNYVTDPDNDEITWSYSGNSSIQVNINNTTKVATLTYPFEYAGEETITFTAKDSANNTASSSALFKVNPTSIPKIELIAPGASNVTADQSYLIKWKDADHDSNATIKVYAVLISPTARDERLIAEGIREDDSRNEILWLTSKTPNGNYRVYAEITDETETVTTESVGYVTVYHRTIRPSDPIRVPVNPQM